MKHSVVLFIVAAVTAVRGPATARAGCKVFDPPGLSENLTIIKDIQRAVNGHACQGLPEVRDSNAFEKTYVQRLVQKPMTDNLMQTSCDGQPLTYSSPSAVCDPPGPEALKGTS